MISAIQKSDSLVSPIVKKSDRKSSAENFSASTHQNEQDYYTSQRNKVISAGILLGAAGLVSAIAYKKFKFNSELTKFKKDLGALYDKTWECISESFDKANLKIEKPNLTFFTDKNSKEWGGYVPGKNLIRINLNKFTNHEYVICKNDKRFITKGSMPFLTLKDAEQLVKDKQLDSSWSIKKANYEEKLFYWNHIVSHEQRHCEQYHLILNDLQFGPKFLLRGAATKLMKSKTDLSEKEAMNLAKSQNPYWKDFKPKRDIKNLFLMLSSIFKGKRVLFSAKNLARNHAEYTLDDVEKYILNSLEIDANDFGLKSLKENKEGQQNCRKEILAYIMQLQKMKNDENLTKFIEVNKNNIK